MKLCTFPKKRQTPEAQRHHVRVHQPEQLFSSLLIQRGGRMYVDETMQAHGSKPKLEHMVRTTQMMPENSLFSVIGIGAAHKLFPQTSEAQARAIDSFHIQPSVYK